MSDKKELNDEELLEVKGGYFVDDGIEHFEVDDCFSNGILLYVITQESTSKSPFVFYDEYGKAEEDTYRFNISEKGTRSYLQAIGATYIGKKNEIPYTLIK